MRFLPPGFLNTEALEQRIRGSLVNTVYVRPSGLLMGALAGVGSALVAAFVSIDTTMLLLAQTIATVAMLRIALCFALPRLLIGRTRLLELAWDAGAFAYALLMGVQAAYALWAGLDAAVSMLLVCCALGFASGIAARNAGRPKAAITQLLLCLLPCSLTLLWTKGLAANALGLAILLVIPAMMQITLALHKVLRDSIESAEASRLLADQMQHIAHTDPVTALHNRAGLNHRLQELSVQVPDGERLALLWMDLDRFKEVNDTLGHATGDRVLGEVARRLRKLSPDGAVVARFGGDEFILAAPVPDQETARALAEAVREEISRPIQIELLRLEVGCSLGAAQLPDDGETIESLMLAADLALYHAKLNGRNRVSCFNPAMTRDLTRRREIETELRQALQRDELSIYFQPIVDLATGRIRTFEALVRWFHPDKGELSPDEFIPVAEETGAIITLGNWITAQAARIATHWPDEVTLAVNLSPVQIRAPGAAMAILAALREARLAPERLELEITESVLLDQGAQTEAFIAELSAAGVRFALDDFGTGYSSLSYLSRYPFSKIKVDRSFVAGVDAGVKKAAIIRATSEMAAALDMEIVAEGLETLEQVKTVSAAGCTLGQGYFFSRAVPEHMAGVLLAEQHEPPRPRLVVG